jgi:hypothetical protein
MLIQEYQWLRQHQLAPYDQLVTPFAGFGGIEPVHRTLSVDDQAKLMASQINLSKNNLFAFSVILIPI